MSRSNIFVPPPTIIPESEISQSQSQYRITLNQQTYLVSPHHDNTDIVRHCKTPAIEGQMKTLENMRIQTPANTSDVNAKPVLAKSAGYIRSIIDALHASDSSKGGR